MAPPALRIERCPHDELRVDACGLRGMCVACGELFEGAELVSHLMEVNERLEMEVRRAKGVVFELVVRELEGN